MCGKTCILFRFSKEEHTTCSSILYMENIKTVMLTCAALRMKQLIALLLNPRTTFCALI